MPRYKAIRVVVGLAMLSGCVHSAGPAAYAKRLLVDSDPALRREIADLAISHPEDASWEVLLRNHDVLYGQRAFKTCQALRRLEAYSVKVEPVESASQCFWALAREVAEPGKVKPIWLQRIRPEELDTDIERANMFALSLQVYKRRKMWSEMKQAALARIGLGEPEGRWHAYLAESYHALSEYEQAIDEWEIAISLPGGERYRAGLEETRQTLHRAGKEARMAHREGKAIAESLGQDHAGKMFKDVVEIDEPEQSTGAVSDVAGNFLVTWDKLFAPVTATVAGFRRHVLPAVSELDAGCYPFDGRLYVVLAQTGKAAVDTTASMTAGVPEDAAACAEEYFSAFQFMHAGYARFSLIFLHPAASGN